ncbi:MAG TPA: transglutaminase family protein, partial [Burkholderiaceae bacterium]|nr:transglutaminase family protein [Burkholderiaceae bacterium]
MTNELIVEHDTQYRYSTHVGFAQHLAHLTPRSQTGQEVSEFRLDIEPHPSSLYTGPDYFENLRTYFALTTAHESLRVRTHSRVRLQPRFGHLDISESPPWETVRASLQYVAGAPFAAASEFCFCSPRVPWDPSLLEYALASFARERPLLEGAAHLMGRIHKDFRYDATSTDVGTPLLKAFAARTGVCQDFTHVMIGCLRALGLAASYVSGYLFTQPRFALSPAGAGEPVVVGADASHAWVSVFCPRFGWVEFDPTNNAIPGTGHVRLATGRDYSDVAPLRGVVQGGGEHRLHVAVRMVA